MKCADSVRYYKQNGLVVTVKATYVSYVSLFFIVITFTGNISAIDQLFPLSLNIDDNNGRDLIGGTVYRDGTAELNNQLITGDMSQNLHQVTLLFTLNLSLSKSGKYYSSLRDKDGNYLFEQ